MSVAALYRVHNVFLMDYPLEASIRSALEFCDEVCISVGASEDNTFGLIQSLRYEFQERIKFQTDTYIFDREWQVRAWDWAAALTKCDWRFLIDADEVIHEQDAPKLKKLLVETKANLVNLRMIHFYGTPSLYVQKGDFYQRHTRIGRRSVNFRLRNFRTDANRAPVCDPVATINGREIRAHLTGFQSIDIPLYHYGWCRLRKAMGARRIKGRAWYRNDPTYYAGEMPPEEVCAKFKYPPPERRPTLAPFKGQHSRFLTSWLKDPAHQKEWREFA